MADKFSKYEVVEEPEDKFAQYAVDSEDETPSAPNELEGLPKSALAQFLLKMAPSLMKGYSNPKQLAEEQLVNLGRGYLDIGEGIKQLGLRGAEKVGLQPAGSADKYTQDVRAEREHFANTPAGQDPLGKLVRAGSSFTVPGIGLGSGLLAKAGTPLLQKMLIGGTGGAVGGATRFVPEDESRLANTIESGLVGSAIPAAAAIPKGVSTLQEKFIKPLMYKGSPEKTASIIQKGHDVLDEEASKLYSHVEKEAEKRGISQMPIPDKLINQSKKFLPNTEASKKLINNAKTGDYVSIRKLQSDLRKRGERLKGSEFEADRNRGEEVLDLRHKINQEVADTFDVFGHADLKDALLEANQKYTILKDTYYSRPALANMVQKGLRKVPKNINEVVTEISDPMKKIRELHPELEKEVKLAESHEKAKKLLNKVLLTTGGGVVGGALVKYGSNYNLLKDLLSNQ